MEAARREGGSDLGELQGAENAECQQHAQHEAGVADAVDDERLVGGVRGRLLAEVESNQPVAAEADALPADEHQRVVVPQHEKQHEEQEEVEESEEAVVAGRRGPCIPVE